MTIEKQALIQQIKSQDRGKPHHWSVPHSNFSFPFLSFSFLFFPFLSFSFLSFPFLFFSFFLFPEIIKLSEKKCIQTISYIHFQAMRIRQQGYQKSILGTWRLLWSMKLLCFVIVFVGNSKVCPKDSVCQSCRDFYSKELRGNVWIR